MDMNRGILDKKDTRPSSRVSSTSAPQMVRRGSSSLTTRLDVLRNENASPQVSAMNLNDDNYFEGEQSTRETSPLQGNTDEDDKDMPTYSEYRDCKVLEAHDEMARLDLALAAVQLEEKRLKLQWKEHTKQHLSELMSIHRTNPESHAEAENRRLFFELDAPHGKKNMTHSPKAEDPTHLSPSATPRGKRRRKKKKDFVKRNIELAGDAGGPYRMTPAEKERLAELLKESDEEDPAVGGPCDQEGDACVSSFATTSAYTLEPAELARHRYIQYQLNLLGPLCPSNSYFSEGNVFKTSSTSEVPGADAVWEPGGETWASASCAAEYLEKERAKRGDDPLPEVQRLSAEEKHVLLEECQESQRTHPRPPLTRAQRARLLEDPYATSFSHLGPFPADD